jgi:hypothetical protein
MFEEQMLFSLGTDLKSGPGSSVGIATGYGLDDPGIESQWGWDLRTSSDRPWDAIK